MVTFAMDVFDGQGSADRRGSGNLWEYYERGGWKPCSELVNSFLEAQILLGVEPCGMNIDSTGDAKYAWHFDYLTQKRKHRRNPDFGQDGEWETVKTRSIRRAMVLAAPERPFG